MNFNLFSSYDYETHHLVETGARLVSKCARAGAHYAMEAGIAATIGGGAGSILVSAAVSTVYKTLRYRAAKRAESVELNYRRPAVLDDSGTMGRAAMSAFLGSADPCKIDNGRRSKRFCLNPTCNPDLFHYSQLLPPEDPSLHSCVVLVPKACVHCSFRPEDEGFAHVMFYATKEQYHTYVAVRAAKHDSEKKSMHVAMSTICEGRSYNLFELADEMLLEHGGMINHLQECRLLFRHNNVFEGKAYEWYCTAGLWLSRRPFMQWWPRFFDWWMEGLLPIDTITGTDYATEWRHNVMPYSHYRALPPDPLRAGPQPTIAVGQPPAPNTGAPATTAGRDEPAVRPPAPPPPENPPDEDAAPTVQHVTLEMDQTRLPSEGPRAQAPQGGLGLDEEEGEGIIDNAGPTDPVPAIAPVDDGHHTTPARGNIEAARNVLMAQEQQVREHGGLVPVRVIANLSDADRTILERIHCGGKGDLPKQRGMTELVGFEKLIVKAWRTDCVAHYKDNIFKAGPLLSNTVIWDDKDAITKAAAATVRVNAPGTWKLDEVDDDDPHRTHIRQLCRASMKRFYKAFRNKVLAPDRVAAFLARLPLLEELRSSKLTAERFMELINEMRVASKLPPVSANVKLEVIAKHGKSPRLVFDLGLEASVVDTLVAYVYEHMLKEWVEPAMIKGRAREEVLDDITKECSVNTSGERRIGLELDQTGFDNHNRKYKTPREALGAPGHMAELVDTLDYLGRIIGRVANDCWKMFTVKTEAESYSARHYLRFTAKDPKQRWRGMIEELYMFSGRKITSSGNWLCEAAIDLCTNVANPEIIWDQPLVDFSYKFIMFGDSYKAARIAKRRIQSVFYRFWLEGDDQLGWCSWTLLNQVENARLLCEDMGFEIKRVVATGVGKDERLEFVGAHFLFRDGLMIQKMWVPDIGRALICSGAYCADAGELDPRVRATNCGISLLSRAYMAAGRFSPSASYLRALGESWLKAVGADLNTTLVGSGFKEVAWGLEGKSAQALLDLIENKEAVAFSNGHQCRLASCSVQGEITMAEYTRFSARAAAVTRDDTAEYVMSFLPEVLRTKFLGNL